MRSQYQHQVARVFAICGRSLRQAVAGSFLFLVGCNSVWDSFLLDRCPGDAGCTQDLAASDTSDMPAASDTSDMLADSGASDMPGNGAADLAIPPPQCSATFVGPTPKCGTNVNITWNCTGATSCTYVCTGTVPTSSPIICSDTQQIQVNSAANCTLTADGPGGRGTVSASTPCN